MNDRVITEANTRLVEVGMIVPLSVHNPFPIYTHDHRLVGAAVVSVEWGGLGVRCMVDAHTPEAFDLANEISRCRIVFDGQLVGDALSGRIVLMSS